MAYATISTLPANTVIFNDHVIMAGGSNATDSALIRKAKINKDGSLGSWTTIAQLPLAVAGCSVVLANNSLYIVGGVAVSATGYAGDQGLRVYKLDLYGDADAMTNAPVQMRDLPAALVSPNLVYWEDHLIVSGGKNARSALLYDSQDANFTVGETLTGQSSGATMVVGADTDGGTSGTLVASAQTGKFANNEELDGTVAGIAAAQADGDSFVQTQINTTTYRARISWPSGDLSAWESIGTI